MTSPKCFVSYSWDSTTHKDWVRKLATALQNNGVDTRLDQWDVHPGMDLTQYMETCVRDSDFVLLVCTPIFAQKANAGKGDVGYEKAIVTGEIFEGCASPKKFVPLLRAGDPRDSLPSYLKSRAYIDFRDDNAFNASLEDLLRHIFESPTYSRLPLGHRPTFASPTMAQPTSITEPSRKSSRATFEQVFRFAKSTMLKTTDYAEAFARDWIEHSADKDFDTFTDAYQFAKSTMLKTTDYAEAFAKDRIEHFSNKDFGIFKEAVRFAKSDMLKTTDYAEAFAFKRISGRQN